MDDQRHARGGERLEPSGHLAYDARESGDREESPSADRAPERARRRSRADDEPESSGRGFRELERYREWRELRSRLSGDPFEEPLDDDEVWNLLDAPPGDAPEIE